jgi:ADP-ribose pyrophosphatase
MSDLKILSSEKRYSGRVFNLVVDAIEYPSGNRGIREIADHPGGAVAVPVFENGDLLLIHHFRYPVQQRLFELPAGKLDPGEDPRQCVTRELEEETGYLAGSIEKLTSIYTTPGFCNERLHLFLASDLKQSPAGRKLEEGEVGMTLHRTPFPDAIRMIQTGEIVDAKTICGILIAERILNKPATGQSSETNHRVERPSGEQR